jgi:hypothetical protein
MTVGLSVAAGLSMAASLFMAAMLFTIEVLLWGPSMAASLAMGTFYDRRPFLP